VWRRAIRCVDCRSSVLGVISKVSRFCEEAGGGTRRFQADVGYGYSCVHTLLIRQPRRPATIEIESEDVVEIDVEDLAAFNSLVQDGLIEVVTIEDGQPYYRIASEFAGPLDPTTSPWR
jgi:hypothetical protein